MSKEDIDESARGHVGWVVWDHIFCSSENVVDNILLGMIFLS